MMITGLGCKREIVRKWGMHRSGEGTEDKEDQGTLHREDGIVKPTKD